MASNDSLSFNNRGNRQALQDYLKGIQWVNPFCVTLTMTTNTWRDVSQNFRHFMNRLNKKFLGKSFHRYGNRLRVVPVIEGDDVVSPHYHCIIDNPHPHRNQEFITTVRHCWWKTELSKPEVHIQPMTDDGWVNYITKQRSKKSVKDSVDWQNTYI